MTIPSKKNILSRKVQEIPLSGIRKFFDLIAAKDDVISLGVGEPDFVTPWHIREAATYSIERGQTHYTSNFGLLELRREIALHLHNRYGVNYDPENELLVTVGVSEALDLAMRALLNPGDQVIGQEPSYVSYFPNVHLAGGTFVPVPTSMENGFHIDPQAIVERTTDATRALILASPNNPTGSVLPRSDLISIAEIAKDNDLVVISDEIYDRLTYDTEHTCFASLPGMQERTLLMGGFSKSYAMTGWRIGYVAGPAEIIEGMMKIHQYTVMSAPTAGQYAAIEALKNGEPDIIEMHDEYKRRRHLIVDKLKSIGLSCAEPEGAFYAFPSVEQTGLTSIEFAGKLLEEESVAVVPGSAFGESGEGHVRCCYAVSIHEIEEALDRMGRFVKYHSSNGR